MIALSGLIKIGHIQKHSTDVEHKLRVEAS